MINCGHCGESHRTVNDVRSCAGVLPQGPVTAISGSKPPDQDELTQLVRRSLLSAPLRSGELQPSEFLKYESFTVKLAPWSRRSWSRNHERLFALRDPDGVFPGYLRVVAFMLSSEYERIVVEEILPTLVKGNYSISELCTELDLFWQSWFRRQTARAMLAGGIGRSEVEDWALHWFFDPEERHHDNRKSLAFMQRSCNELVRLKVLDWGLGEELRRLLGVHLGMKAPFPPG